MKPILIGGLFILGVVIVLLAAAFSDVSDENYALTHFKAECDGTVIVVNSTRGAEFVAKHCENFKVLP